MDLYDDLDTKQRAGQIDGWSSGVKLLQTQLALKKNAAPATPRRDGTKRTTVYFIYFQIHFINILNLNLSNNHIHIYRF